MHLLRLLPLLAATAAPAPATAEAATDLGALAAPGSHNGATNVIDTTNFQLSTPAGTPGYAVPAGGGVITRWAMQEGTGPFDATGDRAALRVFRATGSGSYTVIGASSDEAMRAPFANLPVRIPVQPGDMLGVRISARSNTGVQGTHTFPGAVLAQIGGDPKQGDTVTPLATSGGWRLNLTAAVEPDADADGFGDETQDACPTSAATQGGCPAPPAPPAPPVLPSPPADRLAPKLVLPKLVARQKASRAHVELPVRSDEAATVQATSIATIKGRRGTLKLAAAKVTVPAGGTALVKVKLGKHAKALRSAVRRGKVAKIAVKLTARDASGNVSTLNRSITLTR